MLSAAQQLKGRILTGGWKVIAEVERSPGATGSTFSTGYIVESPKGVRAYLKALDFSSAFLHNDPMMMLQTMTEAYNFERQLCGQCSDHHMNRVVYAIGDGKIQIDPDNPFSLVPYLIFELAEGDIRSQLDKFEEFDIAWALRALHHAATGLKQLHSVGVAHQDLKPSNLLEFPQTIFKVADLGRATWKGHPMPHDECDFAGDPSYTPPELLYGYLDSDWNRRRFGCDAYLLGSLVVFFFTRASMTALILDYLDPPYRPESWPESFNDVLPYVRDACGRAIEAFSNEVPSDLREEITIIVRQLCEPDPRLRGHPLNRFGRQNQYSLERYVSRFNLLASKTEYGLLGGK